MRAAIEIDLPVAGEGHEGTNIVRAVVGVVAVRQFGLAADVYGITRVKYPSQFAQQKSGYAVRNISFHYNILLISVSFIYFSNPLSKCSHHSNSIL